MVALWLALITPAHAVETIPKETLVDHLSELREQLDVERLPVGYAGFDVEERLKPIVGPLDFVLAKRMGVGGDPASQLKGLMKKADSPCGLILGGGGRNVTIRTAGACEPELDERAEAIAACRENGLAETFALEPTSRIELLRPSLPEGMSRDDWATASADIPAAVAACVAADGGELPGTLSLTLKAGWTEDGTSMDSKSTKGAAEGVVELCAVRVTSCLPKLEAGAERTLNLVMRFVDAAPEPTEEPAESEEATEEASAP
ncbi:MAG: hypothetical protein KC912_17330 [Proteobacteria bacterium]|nr:hypothetical protein [Pseudomonadota bacterium]